MVSLHYEPCSRCCSTVAADRCRTLRPVGPLGKQAVDWFTPFDSIVFEYFLALYYLRGDQNCE